MSTHAMKTKHPRTGKRISLSIPDSLAEYLKSKPDAQGFIRELIVDRIMRDASDNVLDVARRLAKKYGEYNSECFSGFDTSDEYGYSFIIYADTTKNLCDLGDLDCSHGTEYICLQKNSSGKYVLEIHRELNIYERRGEVGIKFGRAYSADEFALTAANADFDDMCAVIDSAISEMETRLKSAEFAQIIQCAKKLETLAKGK